jgi:hypothetical protein
MLVLTLFVSELELEGGCVKEYTDHIATMMMIGIAMISHLLSPRPFLAEGLPEPFVLSVFFDDIHSINYVTTIQNPTLKLSLGSKTIPA